jgi:hypothetical protein
MSIFHLLPEGIKGEAVLRRFEVFLDIGPVFQRIGEVTHERGS